VNAAPHLNGNPSISAPLSSNAAAGLNAGAAGVSAGTGAQAHTALRPTFGPNAGANVGARANAAGTNAGINAANNFRANWATGSGQAARVSTGLNSALRANTTALNANTAAANTAATNAAANIGANTNTAAAAGFRNPARANYWSNLGNATTNSFLFGNPYGAYGYGGYYGGSPYFGGNFWSGRNLIGLGVASALGGGYGGYGGYGGGLGNWWGYSPWQGSQPYGYWYGNPGWNSFSSNYGQPYYYDYGPGGNVVYQGNQVLVNDQPVATATDYAQSAADLATVTQDQMQADHDWVPLGTFSVATSIEDKNPVRVAQLAYDNKQGLISGTIFNSKSNNLYTLQGKVDKETQRTAFTIGNDPNTVFETGLYNLTQNATPVLLHQGAATTQTWLFARLPEPSADHPAASTAAVPQQPAPTAAAPQQPAADVIPPAPPADELRRE